MTPPPLAPRKADCPICGKPATVADRPFCSPRCARVDLHRWFSGAYAIPAETAVPEAPEGGEGGED